MPPDRYARSHFGPQWKYGSRVPAARLRAARVAGTLGGPPGLPLLRLLLRQRQGPAGSEHVRSSSRGDDAVELGAVRAVRFGQRGCGAAGAGAAGQGAQAMLWRQHLAGMLLQA